MNRDVRIEMPYEAEWIIKKIRERGFEAFAVGGCVRDTLLEPDSWRLGYHHLRKAGRGEGDLREDCGYRASARDGHHH